MNLQRVGQRAGLWCVNNDYQGIPHRSSLTERMGPWQDPRSFFSCFFWCVRDPPPLFLFTPFLIVVFFLLNEVPRVGICPITPYLQLLGVVVRIGKYGCVRHKALNAIKAAFPQTLPFSPLSFSAFVLFLPCGTIWSLATGGLLSLLPSAISIRGGFSHGQEGIFPWAGPVAQYRYRNGPISLLPPTIALQNSAFRLLGRK